MRRIAIGPANRFRVFVVALDVATDLPRQVGNRREDASRQYVALDFREPELDLVEPGRVRRGEVQVDTRMGREKRLDLFRFMSGEIVHDHMDLPPTGLRVDNVLEKVDE